MNIKKLNRQRRWRYGIKVLSYTDKLKVLIDNPPMAMNPIKKKKLLNYIDKILGEFNYE